MIEWFRLGGFFMWPILFSSLWAVALLIDKYISTRKFKNSLQQQSTHYFQLSALKGLSEAYHSIGTAQGMVPEILQAAWNPAYSQVSMAERHVEEVLFRHKPALEKSLNTLSTLAAIQPLLGLLGTISGMIATFSVIASQGTGDPRALADGISEAMITTQAGLSVALPILLGHNYLRNRHRAVMASLQEICARALKERELHGAT